jgi:hypothetical protein
MPTSRGVYPGNVEDPIKSGLSQHVLHGRGIEPVGLEPLDAAWVCGGRHPPVQHRDPMALFHQGVHQMESDKLTTAEYQGVHAFLRVHGW